MCGTGITTGARNGVEGRYRHYAIHNMKWRNIVFQSTARSSRSRHDEEQVEEPPFLKNRAKPLTAPAYHIEDEPSIHVLGQLHGRQSVVINERYRNKVARAQFTTDGSLCIPLPFCVILVQWNDT